MWKIPHFSFNFDGFANGDKTKLIKSLVGMLKKIQDPLRIGDPPEEDQKNRLKRS